MTISITIPNIEKPRTVKDAIISILVSQWPLTARKIYHGVKNMGINVSYQAVHKTLGEFIADGVVGKTEGKYQISQEWIERIKELGNRLDSSYKRKEETSLENVIKTGYQSFTFETVFDMYKFILGTIVFFMDHCPQPKHPGIVHYSHMWWALVGSEKEHAKFSRGTSYKSGVYFICAGNTYADKLLAKFYESFGGANIKIRLGVNCANDYELFIIEDYLVQIYLPLKIKKIFDFTYQNFKSGSTDTFRKIYENIIFKKTEINVIINRNPKVAELVRNKTLKYFKK